MLSPLPRFNVRADRRALTVSVSLLIGISACLLAIKPFAHPSDPQSIVSRPETDPKARLNREFGNLPIQFEANEGQGPADVKFISRGRGYNLHLKSDEAVLSVRKNQAETSTLRLRIVGGSTAPQINPVEELPGKMNYFVGNDPANWRKGIKTYKRVEYKDVYPGVDLVYYGREGKLEYDFVIAPKVDPKSIQVSFVGAKQLRVNETGALIVELDGSELVQPAPFLYQETSEGLQQINGRYVLKGSDRFAFEVDAYDPSKPLVIDPTLTYSTFLEGSAQGLIMDSTGNAYITGTTQFDVFVFKLNSSGTALLYSTVFGGTFSDIGVDIAVDSAENVYVTGRTESSDFPMVNAAQPSPGGSFLNQDGFVTKINSTGSGLIYSTYLGGSGFDFTRGIAVTLNGNACVVGGTTSTDFPTSNALQPSKNPASGGDSFATKFSVSGAFVYSTYLGGSGDDAGLTVAIDSSDNTYIAGRTDSTNFPTTVNARQAVLRGDTDGFISKLSPSGNQLLYSTYHGGTSYDAVLVMALDSAGNIYVTGETHSSDFPLLNPIPPNGAFSNDVFVTKFNPTGNAFIYSTYLGGNADDTPWGLALDPTGNLYVTGSTQSADFPLVQPLQRVLNNGDIFITKINSAGTALTFSTYFGSSGGEIPFDIAVNSSGSIFIVGTTGDSSSFPITANAFQATSNFLEAGFALRIDPAPTTNYFSISGKVTGVPFAVPIVLSGSASRSANTDANGRYSFHVLLEGGTYTVTPTSPPGYSFTPSNRTYSALNADHTDTDFVVPPPANDNFVNAQPITDISNAINGTNIGATLETGENIFGNASVWYRWQAPSTRGVVLNKTGGSSGISIAVFTGSSVDGLSKVSGDMSSCTFFDGCNTLGASFKANAGTIYFLRVASSTTATENFSFSFANGVTISGHVRNVNGRDLSASVRATRTDTGEVTSTSSGPNGYSIVVPPGFSYDVLPSLPPVNSFSPVTVNNLTQDVENVNFFAASPTITISGFLNNMTSSAGASIDATGTGISSKPCEIINQGGTFTYKCSSLSVYGDYTIVPKSTNHAFSPTSRTFLNAGGDTGASFSVSLAQPPAATTAAATNVTTTTATLNGSINPNGLATDAWFEWGTSDTLATSTSTVSQAIGSGTSAVPVSANLTNLLAGTTYFFRAVGMNSSGTARGSILSFTTPVQVTIQTNPIGRSFSIDGGPPVTTTQALQWIPGSSHTITTTSPQALTADTRFVWSSWSDNGAISHNITAPAVSTTYTANFTSQYMLTMSAGAGGTVNPVSGFFNSGQTVQITATPSTGFMFNGWTGAGPGSFTGLTNQTNVTMTGPITQTANFLSLTGLLLVLESNGPIPDQVLALDTTILLRDPFPVTSPFFWLYTSDTNTHLTIFLKNFQPVSGELPSAVVVNIVGSNNQSIDVPAQDVRPLPNTDLTQVTFRLPTLPIGTYVIKVKAHNATTNGGTLRIRL